MNPPWLRARTSRTGCPVTDADGVGGDVEGVRDPHPRSVEVRAERGVHRSQVPAVALDEVSGPGEGLY